MKRLSLSVFASVLFVLSACGGNRPESKLEFTVKGVEFDMILVEGGTFTMGTTSDQQTYMVGNRQHPHDVTLSDYYIGETEVTQGLWEAVMGSNPSHQKGNALYPVENVSYETIVNEFLPKLNALTGKKFVLPTESQWEYAARGGKESKGYQCSGGNDPDDVAWHRYNSDNRAHAVGTKAPNELGLYDMSGNVEEICSDWYGDYPQSPQNDPSGPASGEFRVLRSSSYWNSPDFCNITARSRTPQDYWDRSLGFRLAIAL